MFSDFIQERTVYRFVLCMDLMHLLDFNGMAHNQDSIPSIPSSKYTMLVQLLQFLLNWKLAIGFAFVL